MTDLTAYVGKRVVLTLGCGTFEGILTMSSPNKFYLEDSNSPFTSPSCMFTGDSVKEIEDYQNAEINLSNYSEN